MCANPGDNSGKDSVMQVEREHMIGTEGCCRDGVKD